MSALDPSRQIHYFSVAVLVDAFTAFSMNNAVAGFDRVIRITEIHAGLPVLI
jgi:hypothetical protein